MNKDYNKETGKTTWFLTEWWQKTFYVFGILSAGFYILCFCLGFIAGIMEY